MSGFGQNVRAPPASHPGLGRCSPRFGLESCGRRDFSAERGSCRLDERGGQRSGEDHDERPCPASCRTPTEGPVGAKWRQPRNVTEVKRGRQFLCPWASSRVLSASLGALESYAISRRTAPFRESEAPPRRRAHPLNEAEELQLAEGRLALPGRRGLSPVPELSEPIVTAGPWKSSDGDWVPRSGEPIGISDRRTGYRSNGETAGEPADEPPRSHVPREDRALAPECCPAVSRS
jgi:hypothetical protein